MKNAIQRFGLTIVTAFTLVILIFPGQPVKAETLWEGDVFAGPVDNSVSNPVSTVQVSAGSVLSISADPDDLWRIFGTSMPAMLQFTNADGLDSSYGMDYEGIRMGALVARVGDSGAWFYVGTSFSGEVADSGLLYLACWDDPHLYYDNAEYIHVIVSQEDFHPADIDHDNDVDGKDLFAAYINDTMALPVDEFAADFGFMLITDNADLGTLSVSSGMLIPAFTSEVTDYLVQVAEDTDTLQVTPVPADPGATVKVNDVSVESGQPVSLPLVHGNNYINVAVTSLDGTRVKTYSLIVTREPVPVLSSLDVLCNTMTPSFDAAIQVYTVEVAQDVEQIDIVPDTEDPSGIVLVNGSEVTPGLPVPVILSEGLNEIRVDAGNAAGNKTYFVYVQRAVSTALTVYVVDEAHGSDEFETLDGAVAYLNTHLQEDQTGRVIIRTTVPMHVDELSIIRPMTFEVEPGASNVISGPDGKPLIINVSAGWSLSGFAFSGSTGFDISATDSLSVAGCSFSGDTVINMNGSQAAVSKGSGSLAKGFNFIKGGVSGYLDINLYGDSDSDFNVSGTSARGINFNATGSFTGNAGLLFKANLVPGLNVNAALRGNSSARFTGNGALTLSKLGFDMEEDAAVFIEQQTSATLEADFHGIKGRMGLKNVTSASAHLNIDLQDASYIGENNSITDFSLDLGYVNDLVSFGLNENGGYVYKTFSFNGEDAPSNAEISLRFDNVDFEGNFRVGVGGKGKITLDNGTTIALNGELRFTGDMGYLDFSDLNARADLSVTIPESDLQMYLAIERSTLKNGLDMESASGAIYGTVDNVTTVTGGIKILHGLGGGGSKGPDEYAMAHLKGDGPTELVFTGLNITDSKGEPGLYIDKVHGPVTISDCTIDGGLWSIVCSGVDADVTIRDCSLKGGMFIDGDPDLAGGMIDRQYTVKDNTVSQANSGGSCLHSHAIRNVQAENNIMTATAAGAHGILISGGKMIVSGGKIITLGPYICNAIGTGPSAGGANSVVDASDIDPITGTVVTGPYGYVRLTDNTFSNAVVTGYNAGDEGRLLNNPVENNDGLDPDEDVVGSLIDWNEDEHHCPDYPTRCDEWDKDRQECRCGQDGISPPSEPSI